MSLRAPALCLLATLGAACATTKNLPGTEIKDTPDTRAIAETIERYRVALLKKDTGTILMLASPAYLDTSGTPEPGDDLDRAALDLQLPRDLAGLDGLQVSITLRRIAVDGDRAIAEVFFEQFYKVHTPTGPGVARRDADVHRFTFVRTGPQAPWLFASGL